MKKVFVVAGEVSGDKAAAWYVHKFKKNYPDVYLEAVGGLSLKNAGIKIYESIEKLNVAGVIEIVKHVRIILRFLKQLTNYILQNGFEEVVLVDFPGFNLRLAKRLKKANPAIRITYVAPPQIWAWGQWRVKSLKKYCDKLVVLFPFEVEFYKKHGIDAEFLGHPSAEMLRPYFEKNIVDEHLIAILPGSRGSEIDRLFGFFAEVIKRFKLAFPKTKFVLPLAESFSAKRIEDKITQFGLRAWGSDIVIVQGEQEKLQVLSRCCMAITKPGTVSLELALLGIPAVVFYKASWISYFLAKRVVHIIYMSLPNLLLNKVVYKECIQKDCKPKIISAHAKNLYISIRKKDLAYQDVKKDLYLIRNMLDLKQKVD